MDFGGKGAGASASRRQFSKKTDRQRGFQAARSENRSYWYGLCESLHQAGHHVGREAAMTQTQTAKRLAKNSLLYLSLTLTVLATLPVLAGMALFARVLIPALAVASLGALAVSPALRTRLKGA